MTDPTITGRVSRLFTTINLRNANDNSLGDFTAAKGMDDYMPFSNSSLAVPRDDDTNIALRIRGYFNVPSTLAGKTIAFGVYCNDLCAMKVGKDKVLLTPLLTRSGATSRMIYRVQFKQPGLYPIEVLYYQNGDVGFLEWARTDVDVMECPNDLCTTPLTDSMYMDKFKLIDKSELYSAIVGENASCQECGAPGLNCSMGSYCGDGLCQACDVPDHCGPSCVSCPANARLCSAGRCVECVADDQCPRAAPVTFRTASAPIRRRAARTKTAAWQDLRSRSANLRDAAEALLDDGNVSRGSDVSTGCARRRQRSARPTLSVLHPNTATPALASAVPV